MIYFPAPSRQRPALMSAPWKPRTPLILAGLAAWWIVIFVGTHVPGSIIHTLGHRDKIYHCSAFVGLAIFLCAGAACFRRPGWRVYASVLAITAAYGIIDELTQMLVPLRSADPLDWLADITGAA